VVPAHATIADIVQDLELGKRRRSNSISTFPYAATRHGTVHSSLSLVITQAS